MEVILSIFILVFLYNLIFHKNYILLFFIFIFLFIIYYQKPLILTNTDYKNRLNEIIDELLVDREKYIQTNQYPIYKLPKKFRYIYLDKQIIEYLYIIRFIRKFNQDIYIKKIIMIEKMLKIYFNIISGRYEIYTNLDIMKDIYENIKELVNETLISIPRISRRIHRFDRDLHSVYEEKMGKILENLKKRIILISESAEKFI